MKRLVEFPLEKGGSVVVEIEAPEGLGMAPAGRIEEALERAGQTFEEALDKIRPAVATVIQKLHALSDPPDKVEVEFGLKLSAQAGAVIAAASTEAHYKVTLTWNRSPRSS